MQPAMLEKANKVFSEIESEFGCRVVFASVVGSHGIGCASPTSDTDVAFIYVYPKNRYVQMEALPAETIVFRYDETIEFHGYELRHYLRLIRKSNTFPVEMLSGSQFTVTAAGALVWGEHQQVATHRGLEHLAEKHFNRFTHWHNHASIARKEMYTVEESGLTNIKAMLYFAKHLLTCLLIERCPAIVSLPIKLEKLLGEVPNVPDGIYTHVKYLIRARQAGNEKAMITPQIFHQMKLMVTELKMPEQPAHNTSADPRELDAFMFNTLLATEGSNYYDNRLLDTPPLEMVKFRLGLRDDPTPRKERNNG